MALTLLPSDLPVRILHPLEPGSVHAVTSECVVLACEVDPEDAPVQWYKAGQEVEESESLVLQEEGPHRRLVLPAAQPSDGGEFQCVAGEERACFTVTVTGGGPWDGGGAPCPGLPLPADHTPAHGLCPEGQLLQELRGQNRAGPREALPPPFC